MSKVSNFIDSLTSEENTEVLETILQYIDNAETARVLYEQLEESDLDEVLRRIEKQRKDNG